MMPPARNSDDTVERVFTIVNKRGLHARASARFVELASGFESDIQVEKDGMTVGATSIMGLMMLAASPGCAVVVRARGADAEAALDALEKLVAGRFGEEH